MKKKIFSLFICLLMCATIFLAGCDLYDRDLKTYYNAVVASIDFSYKDKQDKTCEYTVEITKRDLINAYNSYGYYYVENYGYTAQQAVEVTLDTIINREFIMAEVKRYCGNELMTDAEKSYLWKETYNAIYENYRNYYDNIVGKSESSSSDSNETTTLYTEYTPAGYYTRNSKGEYEVKRYNKSTYIANTTVLKNQDQVPYDYEAESGEFKKLIYDKILAYFENYQNTTSNKKSEWELAFNSYMNSVRSNYPYEKFDNNKDCFYFEMDRIYNIVKNNFLIEKYQQIYHVMGQDGSVATNVKVSSIINSYVQDVKTDYNKYYNNDSEYETAMLSNSTKVNYVKNNGVNYFNVGVLKINLNTTNGTKDEIEDQFNKEIIDADEYAERLEKLYNSTVAVRDNQGNKTSAAYSAEDLRTLVVNSVNIGEYLDYETLVQDDDFLKNFFSDDYDKTQMTEDEAYEVYSYVAKRNTRTEYKRADAFVDFLYHYNDNYENVKSEKTTVFGVDGTGKVHYSADFSESECDALSEAILDIYNKSYVGAVSEVVRANDGIYILFYAGKVENVFTDVSSQFHLTENDIQTLGFLRVDIFSKQTYFDKYYSSLYSDSSFDTYDEQRMNTLKVNLTDENNEKPIHRYMQNYADLF